MRCSDCIDGEIDPAECCDERVAEEADILRGFRDALQEMVDAAGKVLAELDGPVMAALDEEMPEGLHEAIGALIKADFERESCGGVIDGLIDDFGTSALRALRRDCR